MIISINEGYFRKMYGGKQRSIEDAILICRDAGFNAIDFGLFDALPENNIMLRRDYIEVAKRLKAFAEENGIAIDQTHARFDYQNIAAEDFVPQMIRTVETTKALGAKTVVVHADTGWSYFKDDVLDKIYDSYAPMVERAKALDINIAMETLFEDKNDTRRWRFCSKIEELEAIVSKFNDPNVGICWDFGHAKVAYEEKQFEMMRRVGDKIIATHVHDNHAANDLHLPPFFGNTDWEEAVKALKDVGYKGSFTLELVYGCLPEELVADYAKFNYKIASHLVNKISGID